ncbi:MAG: glycerol-3-phosphate dehydrogenase/oxidase [Methylococcaceae bacterium]|nr:glycerol-3-phosphate dehydrogenase/oxidase [Methylococcaceae bacterium]
MKRDFSRLAEQSFDLLVCGGGIYGAWTAYDATLRGLKVALVDQGDWACATSSASSKLIHGGLRYLETLDFKLVKKALRERQMLMAVAPHRVWPLRFGVPVFKNSRLGSLRLTLGLWLYDFLAGVTGQSDGYHHYRTDDFIKHFPALDDAGLCGGFTYLDGQTDDARFVLELIDGALAAGAVCVNYCQVTDFFEDQGQVSGAHVIDKVDGGAGRVYARQVVNTTGQWTALTKLGQARCRLTKGVHLILPKVLDNAALLLTASQDGRVFFMIPWYGMTLLGTTDTDYSGDLDQVIVNQRDIDYLLNAANRVLKSVQFKESDIIGQYAGLRVLKNDGASTPSALSRDWELKKKDNGLLVSIGGKLTSAREDAACIVDTVCKHLRIDVVCKTFGRPFPWLPDAHFQTWSELMTIRLAKLGLDDECALWLIRRHARRVETICSLIENHPDWLQRIHPDLPLIYADLVFSAQHEMVVHLEDLLRRRMPLLVLAKLTRADIMQLAEIAANELHWNEKTLKEEVERCCQKWQNPTASHL